MRTGYGHMVLDDYVERLRGKRALRQETLASLSTREDALDYQSRVREAIAKSFGPMPEKTPLNARVTGTIERSLFRIEKVVFESRPGCLVTANLYIPHELKGPAPGVIGACGHSATGKAESLYQGFSQRLAASGFVVLTYDPINQGERDQYGGLAERESVRACTRAHNMMGKQLELLGDFFGAWRVWDGVRALDYLLSRPEVDASRTGLTGNSGGGTLTTWLWPLEPTITMAAPGCFVTTFLSNLENELPADSEQYPPGVLGAGLEMADFLIARAPDPVIILGQHYDYFDRRGHQEACDEIRRFYDLLGAPEGTVASYRGSSPHGYTRENQEAMVAFFARHAGIEEVVRITEVEPLSEEALFATPGGDVVAAGATPVYSLIADRATELEAARAELSDDAIRTKLSDLLRLPEKRTVPHHRNLRPRTHEGTTIARYAIETERGIRAILHKTMAVSERANSLDVEADVSLYLPHLASEDDLGCDALALSLQEEGELYALDVRGLGETRPDEGGDASAFWGSYGMDYMMHGHGLLFGESYLGRRVLDALCTIDLLVAEGAERIHLYGRGQGSIIALFVAVLHEAVADVTLKNCPTSYMEWAQTPLVDWPAANCLRGVLGHLDLPDCVRALGDRATIIEPWDARMQPV